MPEGGDHRAAELTARQLAHGLGLGMVAELRSAGLFAYLVATDTYRTAQAVDEILVKTHPTDTDKIETIIQLVSGAIDIEGFLAHL